MAEYSLIKIEEFVVKPVVTGNEWIPAGLGGTYRIKASVLMDALIKLRNLLSGTDVINNLNSTSSNQPVSALQAKILKDLVDSKIDLDKIIDNLTTDSDQFVLSARQGKVLHDLIEGFAGQIGSGIIGEAVPSTDPISVGFGIYTTSTEGVYINFLDSLGNPIEVTNSDLIAGSGGLVQLWGNDNIWEKHVTIIDNITLPTPSNETFIIL